MTTVNELLYQEKIDDAYKEYRNEPRNIINYGVRPNAQKCLESYNRLQIALAGGNDSIIDISSKSEVFSIITSSVLPFIAILQNAMKLIIDTPIFIDQLAAMQGMEVLPFLGVGSDSMITPEEYVILLYEAMTSIQNVISILESE
jgi:hypothetical protein